VGDCAPLAVSVTQRDPASSRCGVVIDKVVIDKSVDNLALLWGSNDLATMRGPLHGECCFTPSWPTLLISEGLVHAPADAAWAAHSLAQNRSLNRCRRPPIARRGFRLCRLQRHLPDQAEVRRGTGAELILIIVLLAGGIIYATFASNPMSFDDLIELRFLPSRRRHRDPEYFEQLKSMIFPREASYRVRDESGPQQNTFKIADSQAEFEKDEFADTP